MEGVADVKRHKKETRTTTRKKEKKTLIIYRYYYCQWRNSREHMNKQ